MKRIYVNLETGNLCTAQQVDLYGSYPYIFYGSKPEWRIRYYTNSVNHVPYPDFNGATAFRASVDVDLDGNTQVLCRTLDTDIDKSEKQYGILTVPLNALTTEFRTASNGYESRKAFFELWGYDSNANPVFYHRFEIRISGVVDATGGTAPTPVGIDIYTAAQVNALLNAGFDLQFKSGSGEPHTTQALTDTHYRFRNADLTSADWSPWIALVQGTPGTGNNWFTGSGAPTYVASVHSVGDMYLNTVNSDVWQVQTVEGVTDFVQVGNIKGATGLAGLKGDKGDPGEDGEDGEDGATGPQGPAGQDGQDGQDGADGEDGAAAGFGTPTATATAIASSAEPTVQITASGPDTAKVFALAFGIPAGQFENGVQPFSFTSSDLTNNVLVKTFAQLGIYGTNPIPVQIVDNGGVVRDADSQVSVTWTATGISVDLSQISGGITGTWKLIFGGGSDASIVGNINSILDNINGEVL